MFVMSSLKVCGWVAVEWNGEEGVTNHHDPLNKALFLGGNNPLIRPYFSWGGVALGGWGKIVFLGRLGMVKALHFQTFPEKVFGPPRTEPKHLPRRYLDVQQW